MFLGLVDFMAFSIVLLKYMFPSTCEIATHLGTTYGFHHKRWSRISLRCVWKKPKTADNVQNRRSAECFQYKIKAFRPNVGLSQSCSCPPSECLTQVLKVTKQTRSSDKTREAERHKNRPKFDIHGSVHRG